MIKATGKKPSGARLSNILKSPNYKEGKFQNIEHTEMNPNKIPFIKLLAQYFNKPGNARPGKALPFIKTNLATLNNDKPTIVWFGHSSYLISVSGFNILVDPVFSGHASPVSFIGKSFEGADNYTAGDMPVIDILIITHDHYDHLDFETIVKINGKVKKVVTALGVGAHLEYWGIDKNKIVELDHWDTDATTAGVEITATPAGIFLEEVLLGIKHSGPVMF